MKLSLLAILLPAASHAFAPEPIATIRRSPRGGGFALRNEIDDAAEKIVSTTEEYVGKADDLVVNRAMRVVDHAPAFFTLKALADAGGISASMNGIASNPAAFEGLGTALTVPSVMFNVWAAVCVFQALSLAKSALASDGNELSQADITATAAANFMATRAVGSANPLLDTILTAVVSGYAVRNGSAGGEANIHSISLQLMSSFTTVLSVLGLVSAISAKVPVLAECSQVITWLGIAAYYVMVTREGNGTTKKAVNAGVLAGMLVNAIKGGVDLSLNVGSLMTNVGVLGVGYLAYEGVNRLRKAVFA